MLLEGSVVNVVQRTPDIAEEIIPREQRHL